METGNFLPVAKAVEILVQISTKDGQEQKHKSNSFPQQFSDPQLLISTSCLDFIYKYMKFHEFTTTIP